MLTILKRTCEPGQVTDAQARFAFSVYQYRQAGECDHRHGKNGSMSCRAEPRDRLATDIPRHRIECQIVRNGYQAYGHDFEPDYAIYTSGSRFQSHAHCTRSNILVETRLLLCQKIPY